jgi:hypothetical protein
MNRVKITILVGVLLSLIGCKSTPVVEDKGLALRKSQPIKLFMGTCVVGRESEASLTQMAVREGFVEAPDEIAQKYLSGKDGKAWYLIDQAGTYGLTFLKSNLCSVYVHKGNPEKIQASMEAWLPPSDSGFTYKKELVSQRDSLTTTSYTLYRGANVLEQWLITVNSEPSTGLVAIMSYQKP